MPDNATQVRYRERSFVPTTGLPVRPVGLVLPADCRFVEWPDVLAFRTAMGRDSFLSPMMDEGLLHWGSYEAGQLVALHALSWSKKKRNDAWGRYVNSYYGYTLPSARFRGHGEALFRHVQVVARQAGYDRIKSLIQSIGGVRLHLHLEHDYWGVDPHGMILVDARLAPDVTEPADSVPMQVRTRAVGEPRKLDAKAMLDIVADPFGIFARPWDEAVELIARYPLLRP